MALAKRELVDPGSKLSIVKQCDLLQIPRSSYYYKRVVKDDAYHMRLIDEIYTKKPYFGVRRIRDELWDEYGEVVNHKRVHRLMKAMGIQAVTPKPYTSKGNKEHETHPYLLRDLEIKAANEVWATDITYIRMRKGFMYLVATLDWYSRYVVGWELSNTLEVDSCVSTMRNAIQNYGRPVISNTDQGSQFTSSKFIKVLRDNGIQISMDGVGRCFDNIMVERLWRTVKYEEVYLKDYKDGDEARQNLEEYFNFYNRERRHYGLDRRVPLDVYFNS